LTIPLSEKKKNGVIGENSGGEEEGEVSQSRRHPEKKDGS